MNQSEQIDQIATALAVAQGQFVNPPRNREVEVQMKAGGKYSFTYATLDTVMDMVRGPLAANGLALCHSLAEDDKGPTCVTRLIHTSGQWVETWFPIIVAEDANAQGWGSGVTYARRNGLLILLAVAADQDDDGNNACGNSAAGKDRAPPRKAQGKAVNGEASKRAAAIRDIEASNKCSALAELADRIAASGFSPAVLFELTEKIDNKMLDSILLQVETATAEVCGKMKTFAEKYLPSTKRTVALGAITARLAELIAQPTT